MEFIRNQRSDIMANKFPTGQWSNLSVAISGVSKDFFRMVIFMGIYTFEKVNQVKSTGSMINKQFTINQYR